MSAYVVAIEGLDALKEFDELPGRVLRAARMAVNKTLDRARPAAARGIREQINFPARYLSGEDGRLSITKRASGADLEGKIVGRRRATSLARFIRGNPQSKKPGLSVAIKAGGGARYMPRAFVIRLRAGSATIDTQSNLGLAVRTANGEKPRGAYKPKKIGSNLWLLYGPSVDQVFRTVRDDIRPDMTDFLEAEFARLMNVENFR